MNIDDNFILNKLMNLSKKVGCGAKKGFQKLAFELSGKNWEFSSTI
jgi:hypothetical protein